MTGARAARFGAIKTRREVLHIGRWESGRMVASRALSHMGPGVEMPRMAARREVGRIAARAAPAGIAGCRDLIRSQDQQGAARRSLPPGPHNLAHKKRRVSRPFRRVRK